MSGVAVLLVTDLQFRRIEAAWEICSYGSARKAFGEWARTFRECVAEELGYEPPDQFALTTTPESN